MKTIVIAEIGENHYGNWDICRAMVAEVAAGGATRGPPARTAAVGVHLMRSGHVGAGSEPDAVTDNSVSDRL